MNLELDLQEITIKLNIKKYNEEKPKLGQLIFWLPYGDIYPAIHDEYKKKHEYWAEFDEETFSKLIEIKAVAANSLMHDICDAIATREAWRMKEREGKKNEV